MEEWIAPNLSEGLGNRLFQYACAKGYAEKRGVQLVFFLPRCNKTNHGRFDTIFKLFPEVPLLETGQVWNEVNEEGISIYKYTMIDASLKLPLVINGYRQSYKYFENIVLEPDFLNVISQERIQYLNHKYLQNKENLFFIHVRLGDFRILPHHQINISKYYITALQQIPESSEIIVFSDEPELIKGLFNIPHTLCMEMDEVETLYLMSHACKGAIVANSTFSFMGAYLAHMKNKNYMAFFPSVLGRDCMALTDYIPSWGRIIEATF